MRNVRAKANIDPLLGHFLCNVRFLAWPDPRLNSIGEVFSRNDFGESKVVSAELSESSETLVVLCNISGGVKDWALARALVEDRLFVHESLGSFFTLEGAKKQYVLERGLKWEGGDTIDDYC